MSILKKAFKFVFSPISTKGVFDSEQVEELVNKGMEMADDAVYTKQERAKNKNKFLDWWLKYLDTTKGQNIARREIAVYAVRTYLALVVFGCIIFPLNSEWADFVFKMLKETLFWMVTAIVMFYFGSGMLRTSVTGNEENTKKGNK